MKYSLFLSLALGIGWLLSPEALVIAGNCAGQLGWLSLPLLVAVALLFAVCGRLLHSPQLPSTPNRAYLTLRSLTGTIPAISLTLASCIPLVILAATALLVTSGYTFNEVFLYWFPNFGFSFLLLALLTLLQFFPEKIIFRAQICFVSLAAGGLLILALYGTISAENPLSGIIQQPGSFSSASSAALLLLFAGSTVTAKSQQPFPLVPIAGLVIFFFWILASLAYVSPERLASSTIPYMTAARKIMGEPGRQIMGVVVISGTCAAITGLMLLCRRMLGGFAGESTSSETFAGKGQRWIFPPLIATITGSLMATGLAGDELLEVLLRGALILWLLHYTLSCSSALFYIKQETGSIPLPGSICTLLLLAGLATLIISNPQRNEMLLFLVSILGISGLLATIWFFINKNTQQMEKFT